MFQTLDTEPYSENDNAHRHSFIRSCSKKDFSFEWPDSIFSFSWRYWLGYHIRIEQSIAMPSVNHLEIFFWRSLSTTLDTTTENRWISSKTCRASSVVGAPSGRHSRLGPALSALHPLNDLIFLTHDWLQECSKNSCSPEMLSHKKDSEKCRMILRFFLMTNKTRNVSSTAVLSTPFFISVAFPHQLFISTSWVERLTFR